MNHFVYVPGQEKMCHVAFAASRHSSQLLCLQSDQKLGSLYEEFVVPWLSKAQFAMDQLRLNRCED